MIEEDFEKKFKAYSMRREELEKQFDLQHKDKTPEEMTQIGAQVMIDSLEKEKSEQRSKIQALKGLFNACNPLPSNRFKK